MLILFIVITCGAGGTLTAAYPTHSISTFISLVTIWNYLGRVTSGFSSEVLLKKYKFPCPLLLTLVLLLSCVGHLLITFGIPNRLYFASVIIGFCSGAQWPLFFAIVSEIFGLKYCSTLINVGGAASPIGTYLLNVKMADNLYDAEALKQLEALGRVRKAGEDLTCEGVNCYKLAFIIMAAVALFGSLV
ncbi:PREDICTED: NUCLEAR FUSION DEFECTIVE [Prunus dulcis]|uniref:PREDICTED: NUCLEAR FUSION DEFECTIVE n=1 Tax=Prunus dulcis TaxID=3755 RepID=A0A5E4F7K7_PRUDU|nr:PREDICTED: NUCLEAR FUSION DEFECTIVE [Prunus dulcis]